MQGIKLSARIREICLDMNKLQLFLKKKDIEISGKRYFIDAMSAMAMGLFSSLLVGTILRTVGQQLHITFLTDTI